ncbi:MAG: DUF2924 domain-containing protein [Planctomycetes bacterium]|nr:DUF2924 domain-containing protein [Planctomycetota bacterium]
MMDIAKEIDNLRQLKVPELVARYETVYGKPPRVKNREWLWKRIAWKIQEQRFGGLSETARKRLEELIAEIKLPVGEQKRTISGKLRDTSKPDEPAVGSTISRQWRGQEIQAKVVEGGFEWNGVVYRSLSAVAQAVTGAHWNGKLFFGLVSRKKAK